MIAKKKWLLLAALLLSNVLFVSAKVKLPAVLSDNMVLQRQTAVNLWGWGMPGDKIVIKTSWDNVKYRTTCKADGSWMTQVATPEAGGPYEISISDGDPVVLRNIMIGEVWLCSGQSNMEMKLKAAHGQPIIGAADAIARANSRKGIRMCTVRRNPALQPLDTCGGMWQVNYPEAVANTSAVAYFFAEYLWDALQIPVGIICSSWSGSWIQPWIDKEEFRNFPDVYERILQADTVKVKDPYSQPTVLYNGMIHPIRNYTLRGVIWYQGEGNVYEPSDRYKKLMPAMVSCWRRVFQQDLSFYYVQIAPFKYGNPNGTEAAGLRQAQFECLESIPNVGMVATTDIGERECIHPANKPEVGRRLALWALARTYGVNAVPYSGPLFKSCRLENDWLVVEFDHAGSGLVTNGEPVTGFEILDSAGNIHRAEARIDGSRIKVRCGGITDSRELRFGYRNYLPTNLYNGYMLPAVPFRALIEPAR